MIPFLRRATTLLAWLVVGLAAVGAVLAPLFDWILAHMEGDAASISAWLPLSGLLLAIALGGGLLIRGRLLGLALLAVPALQLLIETDVLVALIYLSAVALIFGAPQALARSDRRTTVGAPDQ
jgi:hypothetical protein